MRSRVLVVVEKWQLKNVYVVLGVLAVVVALAALFPAITSALRLFRRSVPTEEKIQGMIEA